MKWYLILHFSSTVYYTPCQPSNDAVCFNNNNQTYVGASEQKIEMPSVEVCKQVAKMNKDTSCWANAE